MPQLAREEQVVGAALADHHAVAGAVHLGVAADGRVRADQVPALDQDIRLGEADARGTARIDRKEADIGLLLRHHVDRFAGGIDHHQLQRHTEPLRQGVRQIDGDAGRLPLRIQAGQDGVAQVDGGTQGARGCEIGKQGRIEGHAG